MAYANGMHRKSLTASFVQFCAVFLFPVFAAFRLAGKFKSLGGSFYCGLKVHHCSCS